MPHCSPEHKLRLCDLYADAVRRVVEIKIGDKVESRLGAKREKLLRRSLAVSGVDLLRALHQNGGHRLHVRVRVAIPQRHLHLTAQVNGQDALERLFHQKSIDERPNILVVGEQQVGTKHGRGFRGGARPEVTHQLGGGSEEKEWSQLVAQQLQGHASQGRVLFFGGHFVLRLIGTFFATC